MVLDGLWHEVIACPTREGNSGQCPTSWDAWHAQWETSPHKTNLFNFLNTLSELLCDAMLQ